MQSCVWDGRRLYVGDYGALARVDLDAGSVELLEEDELGVNRMSLVKDGSDLWYAAFADWPSVERCTPRGGTSFSLLNQEMLEPDMLLSHRGRLLASSPAGIVEIDEPKRSFVQYRLLDDPEALGIYGLTLQDRKLLGARDDGWVELDLRGRRATHYRLDGPGADNRVLAIGWFDGDWYLGTGSGLVRVL